MSALTYNNKHFSNTPRHVSQRKLATVVDKTGKEETAGGANQHRAQCGPSLPCQRGPSLHPRRGQESPGFTRLSLTQMADKWNLVKHDREC